MNFDRNAEKAKFNLFVRNYGYPELEVEIKTVDQSTKIVPD